MTIYSTQNGAGASPQDNTSVPPPCGRSVAAQPIQPGPQAHAPCSLVEPGTQTIVVTQELPVAITDAQARHVLAAEYAVAWPDGHTVVDGFKLVRHP